MLTVSLKISRKIWQILSNSIVDQLYTLRQEAVYRTRERGVFWYTIGISHWLFLGHSCLLVVKPGPPAVNASSPSTFPISLKCLFWQGEKRLPFLFKATGNVDGEIKFFWGMLGNPWKTILFPRHFSPSAWRLGSCIWDPFKNSRGNLQLKWPVIKEDPNLPKKQISKPNPLPG